jgi:hypothetical protein
VVGLSYSNKRETTDLDIQIWKAEAGAGSVSSLMFTWELRQVRVARRSDLEANNITFNPGDKLSLFIEGPPGTPGSDNPQDPVFDVYMQIDEQLDEEGSESFTGSIGP